MTTAEHQQTQSANQGNEMAAQLDLAHVLLEANSINPTQERTQVLASYILDSLMKAQEEEGLEETRDGKMVKPEEGFFARLEDGLKDGSLLPELEKKAESDDKVLPVPATKADSELTTRVQSAVTAEKEKQSIRLDGKTRRENKKRQKIADRLEHRITKKFEHGQTRIVVGEDSAVKTIADIMFVWITPWLKELDGTSIIPAGGLDAEMAREAAVKNEIIRRFASRGIKLVDGWPIRREEERFFGGERYSFNLRSVNKNQAIKTKR